MPTDLETRDRLLIYARDRFLQSGFSKVRLDEIAAELGISKKTLYKFFPSKEEILRAALHMTMRGIEQSVERIAAADKPFAEKLAEVMMLMGKNIGRISRLVQIDLQRSAPGLWKEMAKFREERLLSKLTGMILKAREERIFREDVNEQVLIHMLIHSVQGILNPEFLSQHPLTAHDAARAVFRVLFEGALTDEARKDFHVFDSPKSSTLPQERSL